MKDDILNSILLSKGIIHYDPADHEEKISGKKPTKSQLAAFLKTFASFGYAFDPTSVDFLRGLDAGILTDFYRSTIAFINQSSGAAYDMKRVFYPQFPDVGDIPLAELYLNAMLHYVTVALNDAGCPIEVYYPDVKEEDKVKLPFDEKHKPTILKIVTSESECAEKVLYPFFEESFSAPVAIPLVKFEQLAHVFDYACEHDRGVIIPKDIPFKENVARYMDCITRHFGGLKKYLVSPLAEKDGGPHFDFLRTVTDYLRLYCVVSGGSPMLDGKTKFKSQPRIVRRWIMAGLESILYQSAENASEFAEHREIWLRAFEYLHPGEFKDCFVEVNDAAYNLRKGELGTFNGRVEAALKADARTAVAVLKKRPGAFTRRLDAIFRNPKWTPADKEVFIKGWESVSDKVSVPVLYQLLDHLISRDMPIESGRAFVIKTDYGVKTHLEEEDNRFPLSPDTILRLRSSISFAIARNVGRNGGQKVHLTCPLESLSNYALPTNDRSVSGNVKDVPFGSYVEIKPKKDEKVVRLFTHWRNGKDRVDIDLSAQMFRADFSYLGCLSWHSLGINGEGIYFSGDVTDAPKGANEFIDVDVKTFRKRFPNVRYVAIVNNVFTGQPFSEVPECCSGVMLRSNVNSGEIFEPSSVVTKFDLHQDSASQSMALVLDLVSLRLYKVDRPMIGCGSVAACHVDANGALIRRVVSDKTMLSTAIANAIAGKRLDPHCAPEEAEVTIGLDEKADVHPWDQEKIAKIVFQPLDGTKSKD